jgi:hypothetical protein
VIPWTYIQVIQVTDECQPQMYPLFEALDAEEPTYLAGWRRGEYVCFCPKDDKLLNKIKGPQLRR